MRRFLAGLLTGILVAWALFAGIGHILDIEDPLVSADVIVALSGDAGPRTQTAIDLWKRQYAPLILFAGAAVDPNSVASGEIMKGEALATGVPEAACLLGTVISRATTHSR